MTSEEKLNLLRTFATVNSEILLTLALEAMDATAKAATFGGSLGNIRNILDT